MSILIESSIAQPIIEGEGSDKKLYIEGIMCSADVVNRNKRIYPKNVMESAVNKYRQDYIDTNTAGMELNHPKDSLEVDYDRVAARLLSIKEDGNNYIGRALVVDTPCGRTVKGLLEGGFNIGVSTRGAGSLKMTESGVAVVQNDLHYTAVDLVWHPSNPTSLVKGIMESASPFWNSIEEYADANLIESFKKEMQGMTVKQLNENKLAMFQKFVDAIKVKK